MVSVGNITSEGHDIRSSKFAPSKDYMARGYQRQLDRSDITVDNGIPFASPLIAPFRSHRQTQNHEEKLIWDLLSILFDDYDDNISNGIPLAERYKYAERIRKDRLSKFWSELCREDALDAVSTAQSVEERAIAYLSMNMVVDACNALTQGGDFRLATLVAQIGGDQTMHTAMRAQIQEWRRLNVISEMNDAVRALYEMLSGSVCYCEGKQGPVEDRASGFLISERFKLDWTRAFGLRLWYATLTDESLEWAVHRFMADLEGRETAFPRPWFFTKEGYDPPWSDPRPEQREDVLWGILTLYAARSSPTLHISLRSAVSPENLCGNPVDTRLSFELYHALTPHLPPNASSSEAADSLAISFATELESAGHTLWAIFILLHLSSAASRQIAIQSLLGRQAAHIDPDDEATARVLFEGFHIPQPWLFEAKALYARAVLQDRLAEVRFLQRARNWTEAHAVLCAAVAPKAIIERDYEMLSTVLHEFDGATTGQKPHEWPVGGAVYADFLALLRANPGEEKRNLLMRLLKSVPEMSNHHSAQSVRGFRSTRGRIAPGVARERATESDTFLRSVALQEMGRVVGEAVLASEGSVSLPFPPFKTFLFPFPFPFLFPHPLQHSSTTSLLMLLLKGS